MNDETAFWAVAGASWRGTSHKKTATPCQDALAWERLEGDRVVLAVSDGAGSATLSDLGSKLAVHAAIGAIRAGLSARPSGGEYPDDEKEWRALLSKAASSARDEVSDAARRIGRSPRDLASTLIVTVATPSLTAAIQIGDGGAVIETSDGIIHALTRPDNGEFMGEATFLVSRHAVERAQIVIAPRAQTMALFSDGLQLLALLYPKWEPFEPFFRGVFDFLRDQHDDNVATKIETFLSSDRLLSRTDDDVTLLLARCTKAPAIAPEGETAAAIASPAESAAPAGKAAGGEKPMEVIV